MKSLLAGIVLIIIVGLGGFLYRNAVEYPRQPIACQMDAKVCPDGTSVGRTGSSCTFPACAPPNVSIPDIGIAFAIPEGFIEAEFPDSTAVVAYEKSGVSTSGATTSPDGIVIRRYEIASSTTALATIQETAVSGITGQPVSITSFSSTVIGTHRFTVVSIARFEGVVDTAYYLARNTDVLRFDAIDRDVSNWTDPAMDTSKLTAHSGLTHLLGTLQGV